MKLNLTKGGLFGYVPSGKLTKYNTTYMHKDGRVTSKTWGTFEVTPWQPYTFPLRTGHGGLAGREGVQSGRLVLSPALRAPAGLFLTAAAVLLAAGCGGPQGGAAAPQAPVASAPVVSPSPSLDLPRLSSVLAQQARASGSAPTGAGLSLARQAGTSASYLWETDGGKVCFAQIKAPGAMHEIACAAVTEPAPEPGSRLEALFGPGTGFSESYIVFAAGVGTKVTSVTYEGKERPWQPVRTLSPRATGRDVYYAALPEGHKGWVDVTLRQADGQSAPDRLRVTLDGGS